MVSRMLVLTLVAALLALPVPRAGAQARQDPTMPSYAIMAAGPTLRGALELSLEDAVRMALKNNLQIEIQRHEPLIAREDEEIAWGAFDPNFDAEFGWSDIENPNANILTGTGAPLTEPISVTTTRTLDGFGALSGIVPMLGAEYEIRLSGERTSTDIAIQSLSPELRSELSFGISIPLLKDLIWNEPWFRVKTNRVQSEAALEQFRTDVMNLVRDVEDSYWVLIARDEDVRVAEKSLETAQALLDQTQTQYEVGVVSKVEVVQAEAGVASRDFELIGARNAYRNQQDVVIDLILGPGLRPESTLEIRPTDRPGDYLAYDIDLEMAVQRAFQLRPELAVAAKNVERFEIGLKFAKNQRLPQLDAVFSYGNRGLSGDFRDPATATAQGFPTSLGAFGDTFDRFLSGAPEQITARAVVSIPIPNTAGRHGVSRAQLELRQARVQLRRLEQDIILDVRQKARNLQAAQQGIGAAERARLAAAEQLRAERIRLEYGESTPFDVLLREEQLVDSESGKIAALQIYRTSATDLRRAQGTILRDRNIFIDTARPLR